MLLPLISRTMNYILQLDPDTWQRLARLQGKVVKIHFIDLNMDCFVHIREHGLELTQTFEGLADTYIRGKLLSLVRVGFSGASGPILFQEGIEILGDTELGEKIRDILRKVDIDGEEYFSRYLGDSLAHELTWRTKKIFALGKQTLNTLGENIRDYYITEAGYLPQRGEVEDFYKKIAVLREDVDRATARFERVIRHHDKYRKSESND